MSGEMKFEIHEEHIDLVFRADRVGRESEIWGYVAMMLSQSSDEHLSMIRDLVKEEIKRRGFWLYE